MVLDNIKEKCSNEYTFIKAYPSKSGRISTHSYFDLKCNTCGRMLHITYGNFYRNGVRCTCRLKENLKNLLGARNKKGSGSKPVIFIENLLKSNNIKYEREKMFSWLKFQKEMRLDFFLPDLNIAIEYDGIQHVSSDHSNIFTKDSINLQK